MKKWILLLSITMFLPGCQSVLELQKEYRVQSKTDEYFSQDVTNWEKLVDIQNLKDDGTWSMSRSWYINELGIKRLDGGMMIENIYSPLGKEMIEVLGAQLGSSFDVFLNEIPEDNDYFLKEKVIDGTGIILQKIKSGEVHLYIVSSSIQMKDEIDSNWLKAICGEDLVVSAATRGEDKHLIEVSYPSYLIRNDFVNLHNTTSYFQMFRTNEGKLERVRMIVNQYMNSDDYSEGDLDPEKLEPLQRMVNELAGEEIDMTDFINDIYKVADQKSSKESGKIGTLNYEVTRKDALIWYEKLIEVVVTP